MAVSKSIRDVMLGSDLSTEHAHEALAHLEEHELIPAIETEEQYQDMVEKYEQCMTLAGKHEFHTPLGIYTTTLGAKIIEWEGRHGVSIDDFIMGNKED